MTRIIGFSGKKQSGKNTSANYLIGTILKEVGIVTNFKITRKGELYVYDLREDVSQAGVLDLSDCSEHLKKHINKYVRLYSFADTLKEEVCMNILGLSRNQCYGTDEDKNTLTNLLWEDMPGVITEERPYPLNGVSSKEWQDTADVEIIGRLGKYYDKLTNGLVYHKPGQMTAREVMQFVGTEVFRRMYKNVWADATIRRIKTDATEIALISDVRFPNEVDVIRNTDNAGVIRFLRDPNKGKDVHESETALDNYPIQNYMAVIDNSNMSIQEQNQAVMELLGNL